MMNPIHKVLSSMHKRQVRCLLMGGQACILYGAAEFSRDADLAVLYVVRWAKREYVSIAHNATVRKWIGGVM